MVEVPDSLVDRLKAREAALVAGLGCGELAGAPGWSALIEWLAARLPFPDERAHVTKLVAAGRMVDAVALVRDLLPHGVLREALREGYPDDAAVPEAIGQTAALPWRAIATTAFDDLWRRALAATRGDGQAPELLVGTDTTARIRAVGPGAPLMHLFGCADRPESLCLGAGDARLRLVPAGGLAWLGELYRRRSLVLVGFRARDPDLAWLLAWVSVTSQSRAPHFIFLDVSAEADPDSEARLLALRSGFQVIACRGGTAEALDRLAQLALEIGGDLPPLDADVDLDAWLARWAAVPSDPEPREVLARAAAALRADARWDRLTELLLRCLPLQEERDEQLAALHEVATIFRDFLNAPDGALRAGLAALRLDPTDDELWEALYADATATGAWSELVAGATEAATAAGATPDAARIWRRVAAVNRHHLGDPDAALAAYQQALDADPDHRDIRDEQIEFLRELGRSTDLVAALQAGAAQTQELSSAAKLLQDAAEVLEEQLADVPGAIASLERVLSIDPDAGAAAEALERLYQREGRWAELALLLARRAGRLPAPAASEARRRRAEIVAEHLGDPDTAAAELEELVAADPTDRAALRLLELIYRRGIRHEDYLDTFRRLADSAPEPEERLGLLRRLAAEGEKRPGGLARAIGALEELLRLAPLDPDALAALLRDYRLAGRFTESADALRRRLEVTEGDEARRPLFAALGDLYERDLGDPQQAFDAYTAAEAAGDRRAELYDKLVRLSERLERWSACAETLRRWAEVTSESEREAALRLKAALLFAGTLGDRDAAERELGRVLEIAPGHTRALTVLARVSRAGGDFQRAGALFLDAALHEADPKEKALILVEAGALVQGELKQEDLATDLYVQALAADPAHLPAAERLAEIYARQEQWGKLDPILDLLAARDQSAAGSGGGDDSDDPERLLALQLQRADLALELGNEDKALACLAEAHRLSPESLTVLKRYAALRARHHQWKEAADLYVALRRLHREALSAGEVYDITMEIGRCRAEEGDVGSAIGWYEDARALEPKQRAPIEALASLHARQNDWSAWIKDRRLLLPSAPTDDQGRLLEEIGDAYLERLHDAPQAAAVYRAALTVEPGRRATLHKLLDLYTKEKQWEPAAETLLALAELEAYPPVRAKMLYAAALIWQNDLGRPAEAAPLLERALDEAPQMSEAFAALEQLHTGKGDWKGLARAYRRMIKRLPGAAFDERRGRLWSQVGAIALERLGDRDTATTAFEAAAALEPGNAHHQETLADLYVQAGPSARDKAIAAHRQLVADDPNRLASYFALAKLYGEIGALDKRWCIAAALSFMRKADPTLEAMFERLRPSKVRLATKPFTDELWQRVRHPGEDRSIDALFALCGARLTAPSAQSAALHGLRRPARVDLEKDPRPLVRALVQLAATLDVAMPDLFLLEGAETPSAILNLRGKGAPRPTLVLGPATFLRQDPFELAFEASKLMSFLRPEWFPRCALLTPVALATALRAILTVTGAPVGTADADGEVQRLAAHLRRTAQPGIVEQLTSAARRLIDTYGQDVDIDVEKWLAATDLSAARAALLIGGDLGAAARVIWSEPIAATLDAKERLKDLIAFSVSEDYFACRAYLGLAVA